MATTLPPSRDLAAGTPMFAETQGGDLVAASRPATGLGWACRAVNGHVPSGREHTLTRLRMFLDGRP